MKPMLASRAVRSWADGAVSASTFAGLVAAMGWLIHRWSASRLWGDLQMLSLAGGALIAHTALGAVGLVQSALDRAGLVVLGVLTVWLLLVLMRRVTSTRLRAETSA